MSDGDDSEPSGSSDGDPSGAGDGDPSGAGDGDPATAGDRLADKFGEPSEFDPTERFGDPEGEAPSAPGVSDPTENLPDPSEADGAVHRAFWTALLWTNVALAGVTLGPAYALLAGGTEIGAAVTVVGIFATLRVYQTVRAFQNRDDGATAAADGGAPPDDSGDGTSETGDDDGTGETGDDDAT